MLLLAARWIFPFARLLSIFLQSFFCSGCFKRKHQTLSSGCNRLGHERWVSDRSGVEQGLTGELLFCLSWLFLASLWRSFLDTRCDGWGAWDHAGVATMAGALGLSSGYANNRIYTGLRTVMDSRWGLYLYHQWRRERQHWRPTFEKFRSQAKARLRPGSTRDDGDVLDL